MLLGPLTFCAQHCVSTCRNQTSAQNEVASAKCKRAGGRLTWHCNDAQRDPETAHTSQSQPAAIAYLRYAWHEH
eukprot:1453270-Rhodomonas_salina.1